MYVGTFGNASTYPNRHPYADGEGRSESHFYSGGPTHRGPHARAYPISHAHGGTGPDRRLDRHADSNTDACPY